MPSPTSTTRQLAIAVDPTGDFFAAGRTCSTSSTSCFTVVRVSAQGKELWRTVLPGSGEADALVQDPQDGNLIVAGKLTSSKGIAFTVVKLDANTGRTLWPASVEDSPLGSANALVLTTRGTVAVAGAVEGKFAVLEYSTGTGVIVARAALLNGQALSVAFDSRDGSVVAVGQRPSSTLLGSQLTVAKFDGAGTAIWLKRFRRQRLHQHRRGGSRQPEHWVNRSGRDVESRNIDDVASRTRRPRAMAQPGFEWLRYKSNKCSRVCRQYRDCRRSTCRRR